MVPGEPDACGFTEVTPLAEARERLRTVCRCTGRTAERSVAEVSGRVLAETVRAQRPVPHYNRAAMDGYAVQAAGTFQASEDSPVRLARTGGEVTAGTARSVHTGSELPDGADAVVMVEHVDRDGGTLNVYDAVAGGENVAPAGEDVDADEQLFDAGHRLAPSDLGLLRAAGLSAVTIADRPRVSVVPTGQELVDPETTPEPGEVVETNGLVVSWLVDRWSGTATYRDIVTDEEAALRQALERDADQDIVVTTGGSSVGGRDLVADVVEEVGDVLVHGVAIKPGHPVGIGRVEETPILMLPGYPVSCLVTAVQLLRPAIAWLQGAEPPALPVTRGRLSGKLRSAPGERTFARVRLADEGARRDQAAGLPAVEPVRVGGAGVMSSVTAADGWVVIPESREGIPAGEEVNIQRWESPHQ